MINEDGEPSNSTGAEVQMSVKPLFISKRYANMREFQVPAEMYNSMRFGRESGERWIKFAADEDLQTQLRSAYHSDNAFMVTCGTTGISSIVRKMPIKGRSEK